MKQSDHGVQTGAIFSGPVWRLWMILNHPTLHLAESHYIKLQKLQRIWTKDQILNREDPSHTDL